MVEPKQAESPQGERIIQTAPERIYLIVGAECPRDVDFSELTEVSWCENDIDDGIEYVRADKAGAAQAGQVPQAWLDVQAERRRQVAAEGWTPEHDNEYDHGQMARAAACYALAGSSAADDKTTALQVSLAWPWDQQWWKPRTARDNLVRAGALVLAEIERLDRAQAQGRQAPEPQTTGHDRLWHWFGLSRSAYAIMPRVMMHAMPDDWQDRMATLLEEWMAFWPNMPDIDACVQIRRAGRMIPTPPWLLNYRHPDRQHLADIHGGALERPSCVEP